MDQGIIFNREKTKGYALTNAATHLIQTPSFHMKNHKNKNVLRNCKRVSVGDIKFAPSSAVILDYRGTVADTAAATYYRHKESE